MVILSFVIILPFFILATFRERLLYLIYYRPLYSLSKSEGIYIAFNLHISIIFVITIIIFLSLFFIIMNIKNISNKIFLMMLLSFLIIWTILFFAYAYNYKISHYPTYNFILGNFYTSFYLDVGLIFITTIPVSLWLAYVIKAIKNNISIKKYLGLASAIWIILFVTIAHKYIIDFTMITSYRNYLAYGYNFTKEVKRETIFFRQPYYYMDADAFGEDIVPVKIRINYYQYLYLQEIEHNNEYGDHYQIFYLPTAKRLLYIRSPQEEERDSYDSILE